MTSTFHGEKVTTEATGNGRLDAVSNALKKAYGLDYQLVTYQEHALRKAPVPEPSPMWASRRREGKMAWGAAVDPDIIRASIDALVTAINNR